MDKNGDLNFYKKAGRPIKYTNEKDRQKAKKLSRQKWYRDGGIDRIAEYNKQYYNKKIKRSKSKSKSKSSRRSKHRKVSRHSKKSKNDMIRKLIKREVKREMEKYLI